MLGSGYMQIVCDICDSSATCRCVNSVIVMYTYHIVEIIFLTLLFPYEITLITHPKSLMKITSYNTVDY